MKGRQQSTTSYPMCFLMVSSTDHVTPVTGLSPTVTISKNGAAFGSPSGVVSEIGSGWYALAGNATDRNTLGDLLIHATGTGADPVDDRYSIVAYDPYDSVRMGLSALPNAAADAPGGLPISDAGGLDLDTILGRITDARMAVLTDWINGGRLDVILDAIAADVAGLDGAAMRGTDNAALASAWTATRAGYIDLLNAYLDAAITSRSSHSAADVWAVTTRTLSSFGTLVSDITTAVWSAGTRTLSGFGSLVADIWSYATRALTDKAGFTISGTKQTLDALNDVSSSTIRTQADAALAAYDAPTKAELDAAVAPLATVKITTDKLDTAMESDGGVYRFTANALEEGPSGTSGGGDATAANQETIITHLIDIKGAGFSGTTDSLESIRDRGDSAWVTGSGLSGSYTVSLTVQDGSSYNIVGAFVDVFDSLNTTFLQRAITDSSGQVSFSMDGGTYYVRIIKAGYSFTATQMIISGDYTHTYNMTPYVISAPASPSLCRVYTYIFKPDGTYHTTLSGTATVDIYTDDNQYYTYRSTAVYDNTTGLIYWDIVRGASAVLTITELEYFGRTITVPDSATSELSDL